MQTQPAYPFFLIAVSLVIFGLLWWWYIERPRKRRSAAFTPIAGTVRPLSARAMTKLVNELDLEPVKARLYSEGWITEEVEAGILEYRKFLYLFGTGTDRLVPWSQELDHVWHTHILMTRKYADDCYSLFGQMLHHEPALMRGSDRYRESYAATTAAFQQHFHPPADASTMAKRHYQEDASDLVFPYALWATATSAPQTGESYSIETAHIYDDTPPTVSDDDGVVAAASCSGSSCGGSN